MNPSHLIYKLFSISALVVMLLVPTIGNAQSLAGSWQGTLSATQNSVLTHPATVTLRLEGTRLTGSIVMQGQGTTDTYTLQGTAQGGQAAGQATYPKDGSVFQFEALLTGEVLAFGVGLNNIPILAGTLVRAGTVSRAESPLQRAQQAHTLTDQLPRNARLVGTWAHSSNYGSSGFNATTRTLLCFFPDGRLGSGGGSANASYDGAAGSSSVGSGSDGVTIVPGAVWYTKGDQIWLRATQQKRPDEVWGRFVMTDDGRAMHLYRGNGRTLYERAN